MLHNVLLQLNCSQRIALHQRRHAHDQVRCNVRIVLLTRKRLKLLTVNRIDVLACWVFGHLVGLGFQNAVNIPHIHRLVDPVVRLVQVVHVRGALRQLELGLCQSDALRSGEDIGVCNGQNRYLVVKVALFNKTRCAGDIIGVLGG